MWLQLLFFKRLRNIVIQIFLVGLRRTLHASILKRYVGSYAPRPGARMPVSIRNGELLIAHSVVLPLSQTEFYFQNWSKTLTFVPTKSNDSWRLVSTRWDGKEDSWPRIDD